ncbi:MAG: protease complex subunit PrcB family protein [Psychroflexus sp.]|nr:protease complex subunit PrcB family protein [Psychroflexus sp.]
MTLIQQSELLGNGKEGIKGSYQVITDADDWTALKDKMNSVNAQGFKMDPVDFSTEIVIALFSDLQGSGGHSIEINDIIQKKDKIIVQVKKTSPSGRATSMMTQPYYIVKLPQTKKEIKFETSQASH